MDHTMEVFGMKKGAGITKAVAFLYSQYLPLITSVSSDHH